MRAVSRPPRPGEVDLQPVLVHLEICHLAREPVLAAIIRLHRTQIVKAKFLASSIDATDGKNQVQSAVIFVERKHMTDRVRADEACTQPHECLSWEELPTARCGGRRPAWTLQFAACWTGNLITGFHRPGGTRAASGKKARAVCSWATGILRVLRSLLQRDQNLDAAYASRQGCSTLPTTAPGMRLESVPRIA